MITAAELPIALGATLDYYASTTRAVALAARAAIVDLSQERSSDTIVAIGPVALDAQWYASQFPAGAVRRRRAASGLDGIYHQDAQALWLDGTASQQACRRQDARRYAAPVAVLRFPLADGDAFYATTAQIADA